MSILILRYIKSLYRYLEIRIFVFLTKKDVPEEEIGTINRRGCDMKIALFYEESSGISSSIADVGRSFEKLGHKIVFVDATDELDAKNVLEDEWVDFIFGYKKYSPELFGVVYRLASFLSIPIIDREWCCHNLSVLIGGKSVLTEGADCCFSEDEHSRNVSSRCVFV